MYGAPRRPSWREDHRGADDALPLAVDEDEDVLARARIGISAAERRSDVEQDVAMAAVVGQIDRVEWRASSDRSSRCSVVPARISIG